MSMLRSRCPNVLLALVFAVLLLFASALPSFAQDQETSMGSITVDLSGDGSDGSQAALSDGTVTLYCVATVDWSDGGRYDVSKGQFADSSVVADIPGMSKKELDDRNATLATSLEKEAATRGLEPMAKADIKSQKAEFPQLPEGLYLLCQSKSSSSNKKMNSFLLSVPNAEGKLDVVARPKKGTSTASKKSGSNAAKSSTSGASGSSGAVTSSNSQVPTTGDASMGWTALAAVGLGVMGAGLFLGWRKQER